MDISLIIKELRGKLAGYSVDVAPHVTRRGTKFTIVVVNTATREKGLMVSCQDRKFENEMDLCDYVQKRAITYFSEQQLLKENK